MSDGGTDVKVPARASPIQRPNSTKGKQIRGGKPHSDDIRAGDKDFLHMHKTDRQEWCKAVIEAALAVQGPIADLWRSATAAALTVPRQGPAPQEQVQPGEQYLTDTDSLEEVEATKKEEA